MTDSIYDQLNAYGTVAKQRFVETFSGDALDTDRWATRDHSGTGTFAMNDSVNGGFGIQVTASSGTSQIDFDTIKQYSPTGAVLIASWRVDETTNTNHNIGFKGNTSNPATTSTEMAAILNTYANSNFGLRSGDATTPSNIYSTIAKDTSFHNYKIELKSSTIDWSIDGVTQTSKTTNRPTARLMPFMMARSEASETKNIACNYVEAYNT